MCQSRRLYECRALYPQDAAGLVDACAHLCQRVLEDSDLVTKSLHFDSRGRSLFMRMRNLFRTMLSGAQTSPQVRSFSAAQLQLLLLVLHHHLQLVDTQPQSSHLLLLLSMLLLPTCIYCLLNVSLIVLLVLLFVLLVLLFINLLRVSSFFTPHRLCLCIQTGQRRLNGSPGHGWSISLRVHDLVLADGALQLPHSLLHSPRLLEGSVERL
mmetsp:Transcript_91/g.249  ORF Transcript_91/g.249 Transcript_91/m.249 type:complete len:211 (-) Transcript_91:463-1095(-)